MHRLLRHASRVLALSNQKSINLSEESSRSRTADLMTECHLSTHLAPEAAVQYIWTDVQHPWHHPALHLPDLNIWQSRSVLICNSNAAPRLSQLRDLVEKAGDVPLPSALQLT